VVAPELHGFAMKLADLRRAFARIGIKGAGDDRIEFTRQAGEHRDSGVIAQRHLASEQVIQKHTQRIDIHRGRWWSGAQHAFGCDVVGGAELIRSRGESPDDRDFVSFMHFSCEAEVRELHFAVAADEDVRGLQVAMDQTMLMRVLDGGADFVENREGALVRELLRA